MYSRHQDGAEAPLLPERRGDAHLACRNQQNLTNIGAVAFFRQHKLLLTPGDQEYNKQIQKTLQQADKLIKRKMSRRTDDFLYKVP